MQQGFCVDALNLAWPDRAYTVSMYRPVRKLPTYEIEEAPNKVTCMVDLTPIITSSETYEIITLWRSNAQKVFAEAQDTF
jgi:hypothetical protein